MSSPASWISIVCGLLLLCGVSSAADSSQPGASADQALAATAMPLAMSQPQPVLPTKLSPWQMFLDADLVVKLVIGMLAIASLITWTIAIAKTVELNRLNLKLNNQIIELSPVTQLSQASEAASMRAGTGLSMLSAVEYEIKIAPEGGDKTGVKERALSRLGRIEAGAVRQMAFGTGLLASIGSTSPFVGLFGTVWGIMNAFIGISESKTTNLAVVAPGIAEALLATALGLVAAIPAVVIYNHFSRRISATRAQVSDLSAMLMQLLSWELDQASSTSRAEPR